MDHATLILALAPVFLLDLGMKIWALVLLSRAEKVRGGSKLAGRWRWTPRAWSGCSCVASEVPRDRVWGGDAQVAHTGEGWSCPLELNTSGVMPSGTEHRGPGPPGPPQEIGVRPWNERRSRPPRSVPGHMSGLVFSSRVHEWAFVQFPDR